MHITYDLPVSIDDILEAKQRLAGKIYKTGMPRSNYFSERCQGEIFLKFENMQRTGSFKIRGAFNKLCGLTAAEKRKGVVACSAGNHAQGVSLSCAMLGIDGKVVMPKGAPKSKVAATCDYSAEVVLHGDNFNDTLAKASDIVELEGRIFIPPYDDPQVIALIQRNKVITEGAGALACAALLSGKLDSYIQNRKTVSLISGGNIDLSRVSQITGFVDA